MKTKINYYAATTNNGTIELMVGVFGDQDLDSIVRCFDIEEGEWLNVDGHLMDWELLDRDDVFEHFGNLDNEIPITFDGDILNLVQYISKH